MSNIYQTLAKPFFALAPMDDVTDTAFRQLVLSCARPALFYTEFASADGYCSKGQEAVKKKLRFSPSELPLIAQIWGTKPENYKLMARDIAEMGFSGIDINMGCPEKKVIRTGAGGALIDNPALAAELIQAVKEGAPKLPVSVKTRLGTKTVVSDKWFSFLLQQNLAALTVHARTVKEMSEVPVHPEQWRLAVELRQQLSPATCIIANGDITSYQAGLQVAKTYGVEGVMIGRGIFTDPYVFSPHPVPLSKSASLNLLLRHIDLFEQTWEDEKRYHSLRRFYKMYIRNFDEAATLRERLMAAEDLPSTRQLIAEELDRISA